MESALGIFSVGPMHCSLDLQVRKNANVKLKLSPMALFTYLKIILLQYFQFLAISVIQTHLMLKTENTIAK